MYVSMYVRMLCVCMCMYVFILCICVDMYVCIYVCTYIRRYVHMYVYMLADFRNLIILSQLAFREITYVGNYQHRFEIVIRAFFIVTASPDENPDEHSCLRECCMSRISLQEITPRLMNNKSY